jgi:hypothetical protein
VQTGVGIVPASASPPPGSGDAASSARRNGYDTVTFFAMPWW